MIDTDQATFTLPDQLEKAKKAIAKKKPTSKKTRRKGKKSIPFDQDPEILARLAAVAEMMLVGAKAFQIAASMNCSLTTAKRDIGRVKQFWKEDARGEIASFRSAALALYRLVIMRAWDEFGKKENTNKKDRYLSLVTATQKEIDRILGVGPQQIDLSGKVEITEEIEEVRKRRWDAIKPQVAEMLKQSGVKI
jgi:hypothetical protein